MNHPRSLLLIFSILCLAASGCQSTPAYMDPPISECKGASITKDYKAPDTVVLSLWRWDVNSSFMVPPETPQQKNPQPVELPTEVQRVTVDGGAHVGFRRENGKLIAVAGETEIELSDGHYSWQLMSMDPRAQVSDNGAQLGSNIKDGAIDEAKDQVHSLDQRYNGNH